MIARIVGTWLPGGFPRWVTLSIGCILFTLSIIRGGDYWLGDSEHVSRNLSVVEQAMPLEQWGMLFFFCGIMGFTGMGVRRARIVFFAHLFAALLYISLGTGIAEIAIERHLDGIRNATILFGVGFINLFFAIGTHMNIRKDQLLKKRGGE